MTNKVKTFLHNRNATHFLNIALFFILILTLWIRIIWPVCIMFADNIFVNETITVTIDSISYTSGGTYITCTDGEQYYDSSGILTNVGVIGNGTVLNISIAKAENEFGRRILKAEVIYNPY